jgi:hypothetical protein
MIPNYATLSLSMRTSIDNRKALLVEVSSVILLFTTLGYIVGISAIFPSEPAQTVSTPLKSGTAPSLQVTWPSVTNSMGTVSTGIQTVETTLTSTITTTNPEGYTHSVIAADATNTCMRHTSKLTDNCAALADSYRIDSKPSTSATLNVGEFALSFDNKATFEPIPAANSRVIENHHGEATSRPSSFIATARLDSADHFAGDYSSGLTISVVGNEIPTPIISSTDREWVYNNAGYNLTITGEHLASTTEISIDGTPCTSAAIISDTQVTCVLPVKPTNFSGYGISLTTWGGELQRIMPSPTSIVRGNVSASTS